MSGEEGRRFVKHSTDLPQLKALFCLTIYYTGCRISEALALHRGAIDLELKVILLRSLKKRGKHEIRRVSVPEFLVAGLESIPIKSHEQSFWQFSRTTAWRTIKKVMRAAQIEGTQATTKGLRHGFGVRGAMMQIPVSLIQTWMGHADSNTTAIYLAIKDDEERKLIEKTW